jgi:glycosyltransferase involved in cell wall biosynthesis
VTASGHQQSGDRPAPALRLSVVVPTYRAPQLLADALRSLAQQTYPAAEVEIVVVDDGTPDFDAGPLAELAAPLPVEALHFDHNRGRSAARNAGIEVAQGAVVIFLDGDMTVEPGFLRAHDEFHRRVSNSAAVGSIRWGPSVPDTSLTRYVTARGVARFPAGPVPYKCFVTGNSSVPRQLLLDHEGFDETLTAYGGEDLELGYRLHRSGVDVHYLPGAGSLHHQWRPLSGMCEAMETYGRHSLPRLVGRHPELIPTLRLRFLERPWWHPWRWLARAALLSPVYGAVLAGAGLSPSIPMPAIVYDYLWWAGRTRGYVESTGI